MRKATPHEGPAARWLAERRRRPASTAGGARPPWPSARSKSVPRTTRGTQWIIASGVGHPPPLCWCRTRCCDCRTLGRCRGANRRSSSRP
eukprot:120158-Prymnesium_polylepis.2